MEAACTEIAESGKTYCKNCPRTYGSDADFDEKVSYYTNILRVSIRPGQTMSRRSEVTKLLAPGAPPYGWQACWIL